MVSSLSHKLGAGLACELQHDEVCLGSAGLMCIKTHVFLTRIASSTGQEHADAKIQEV